MRCREFTILMSKSLLKKILIRLRYWIPLVAFSFLLISTSLLPRLNVLPDTTAPVIDVWYGTHQTFGQAGLAQYWVNVLGNVSDPESGIKHLRYQLNGGAPVTMRLGPDGRRLGAKGDFNAELDPAGLRDGDNTLQFEAVNGKGLASRVTVTLSYHHVVPPLPFVIDWSKVHNAQQVLQVVDGKWRWDASGIRPLELHYDRMIAIGDQSWTNYQVTVPVTFHGYAPDAFQSKEGGKHAGISVDMRWMGHSDDPAQCDPPRCGWNPVGDFNKYFIMPDGKNFLGLKVREKEASFPTIPARFEVGHTYIFKASVQTTPDGNRYRLKVWEQGAQTEPAKWMFDRMSLPGKGALVNPNHGAFSLVAHQSDVTFGNIRVEPIAPDAP